MNAIIPKEIGHIILTRFLYIKDEVEVALLVTILQKKKESIFWAYELYFSGFEMDVFNLIWTIYYDFFAGLNPLFEKYIQEKQEEWNTHKSDVIIGQLVENLLIRPYTCDVYFLQHSHQNQPPTIQPDFSIEYSILSENFQEISNYIFMQEQEDKLINIYNSFVLASKSPGLSSVVVQKLQKIKEDVKQKNMNILKKQILSRILSMFLKKPKGKQFYMIFHEEKVEAYKNPDIEKMKPYRILDSACKFGVNEHGYLCLYQLKRYNMENLLDSYHNDWLFYASFSPIWLHKIQQRNGRIDYENKKICFEKEEDEQHFYDQFNYEPDEQSCELKEKTISTIYDCAKTWQDFQEEYNANGILQI